MKIKIIGAKENNLQNIDLELPLNKLIVFTGISGSGKSSLAFDTIHKEGQRRYLETFSSYARSFIGNFERPNVDHISGLSPVISIEQRSSSNNPRSTVGTTTEIYDHLRLLYSKIATPISYITGAEMQQQDIQTIINTIFKEYKDTQITLLSPVVKGRKGHYSELFQNFIKKGYLKVRIDNEVVTLSNNLKLDRYKNHDIDIIIDKLVINDKSLVRLENSINLALDESNGSLIILNHETGKNQYFSKHLTCPQSGISYQKPQPNSFSFNSPKGYCLKCKGIGKSEKISVDKIIPNKNISIQNGAIKPIGEYKKSWIFEQIDIIGKRYNFNLKTKFEDIPEEGVQAILYGLKDQFKIKNKQIGITQKYSIDFEGIINFIENEYNHNKSTRIIKWAQDFLQQETCSECNGKKLKKESLYFLINNKNISEISDYDVFDLQEWCNNITKYINKKNHDIVDEIIKEINKRLNFLINIGLGYISISRLTSSLSGGENQRIKIASQIGSELTNVLYILDEPSIGLHPIDNELLINSLKKLKNLGNTVIVVEHDKSMMEAADYIVDMGPGAGNNGGDITFHGTYKELLKSNSLTGLYLSGKQKQVIYSKKRINNTNNLILRGAEGNNLKNIDISIPISKLTAITGVSGSGKSTLINGTLFPIINQHLYKSIKKPYKYKSIEGLEHVDKVINIDQSSIGRTSRSNPSTYIGVWTDIRNLYANLKESKIRGYKSSRFSFNLKEGCCDECNGHGYIIVQMKLLPDIEVTCKKCTGKRFNHETLGIMYKDKNIFDILNMTIDEALIFFHQIPRIKHKLKALKDVGMGYIKLGQSSTKLSGGEAQRVKLAAELSKKFTGKTLYILDEPTTGLHFHDIQILMKSINLLVNMGNTMVIIEHNLDVIKEADHIIDLGPKGGKEGGKVIFQGSIDKILNNKISRTGFFLKKEISS